MLGQVLETCTAWFEPSEIALEIPETLAIVRKIGVLHSKNLSTAAEISATGSETQSRLS